MSKKYTKLFIIGNGFDRWQGLPISYKGIKQLQQLVDDAQRILRKAFCDWIKSILIIPENTGYSFAETDVKYHKDLVNYFSKNENHLSKAIRNINQINELKIHDEDLKGNDDYNLLEVIDICINPNYLRLIEGVFAVLLHPVAYFSRIIRNAGLEKLDVFNIVEEINSNFPELQILVQPYHYVVRNIKLCLSWMVFV